ncbi:hypothetical protein SAMN05421788_109152 [Filimonas lacunae]|uniref:Uncharacterized protein n=2 Tax=Filimonas lacunae TaxID=477680 RepID=A0A173MIN2_9BACT|nr:hypothetical protein [Filimonas lacunae]BAV07493.1 hypothetical protein FLA_3519 [Filimonas lacunae]SIT30178.1 hypothetical protein SAMN05421788_109152 [Filimonas lacunae]
MNNSIDILRMQSDIMKKIHAFKMFKIEGMDAVVKFFPKLKPFILANAHKNLEDLECEMIAQLDAIRMEVV